MTPESVSGQMPSSITVNSPWTPPIARESRYSVFAASRGVLPFIARTGRSAAPQSTNRKIFLAICLLPLAQRKSIWRSEFTQGAALRQRYSSNQQPKHFLQLIGADER